jgi:hypothetical protein
VRKARIGAGFFAVRWTNPAPLTESESPSPTTDLEFPPKP